MPHDSDMTERHHGAASTPPVCVGTGGAADLVECDETSDGLSLAAELLRRAAGIIDAEAWHHGGLVDMELDRAGHYTRLALIALEDCVTASGKGSSARTEPVR
jgi:hypothetical protein